MDQERARAQALGYADPVNPSYEATTEMYHKTLAECLRRIKVRTSTYPRIDALSRKSYMYIHLLQVLKDCGDDARKIGIMVASHNEDTVRFAIENMKTIGISPEDKVICFGQLLGMCDYITFPLGMLNVNAMIELSSILTFSSAYRSGRLLGVQVYSVRSSRGSAPLFVASCPGE